MLLKIHEPAHLPRSLLSTLNRKFRVRVLFLLDVYTWVTVSTKLAFVHTLSCHAITLESKMAPMVVLQNLDPPICPMQVDFSLPHTQVTTPLSTVKWWSEFPRLSERLVPFSLTIEAVLLWHLKLRKLSPTNYSDLCLPWAHTTIWDGTFIFPGERSGCLSSSSCHLLCHLEQVPNIFTGVIIRVPT